MSEPWFRPNGVLNYRTPVRIATLVAMATAVGWGFLFTEPEAPAWWASGALGLLFFVVGHVIVLWKMDWGYGRRK